MRAHGAILGALLLVACSKHAAGPYEDALARAASEKKVVLIDFFSASCAPCQRLEQETWTNTMVGQWLEHRAVKVALDADQERTLAAHFQVTCYPTLVFVTPAGRELGRIVGFRDPVKFVVEAEQALGSQDEVGNARAALEGYEFDPQRRQFLAVALEHAGRYEEALLHYLWCFDHGVEQSFMYASIQNNSLVRHMAQLVQKYPLARPELCDRRTVLEGKLLSKSVAGITVLRLVALNQALNDKSRNLALYDDLCQRGPAGKQLRSVVVMLLLDDLFAKQRYADLLENAGDVPARLEKKLAHFAKLPPLGEHADEFTSLSRELARADLDKYIRVYYECLLGTGRFGEAARVAELALTAEPTSNLFLALIQRCMSTESIDQGRELVQAWLGRLEITAAERERVCESLDERLR